MRRLVWALAGRACHIVGNLMPRLIELLFIDRGLKLFPCSTQLSTKFILLINVKMPTIVGILKFTSMINTTSERLRLMQETPLFVGLLIFMSS